MTEPSGQVQPLAAARGIAQFWPRKATYSTKTGLPSCIETTRAVLDAFEVAGLTDARPLPVGVTLWNREATLAIAQGRDAGDDAERIMLDPRDKRHRKLPAGAWWGHLIVDHPAFVLDLTLPGLVRSARAKGFDGITSLCAVKHEEVHQLDDHAWVGVSALGIAVRYDPMPRLAAWRNTDAWRSPANPEIVELLAGAIDSAAVLPS